MMLSDDLGISMVESVAIITKAAFKEMHKSELHKSEL